MKFDMLNYRYPSRRSVIYGRKGMVCTSQPLAAQAGLDILKKGGNAVDAMIATAICMTVLEPTGNGLGSDAFDLVWFGGRLYGLNGSGGAAKLQTLEKMKAKGYDSMPQRGWDSVTVPGAVSAWSELHQRFGRLPFKDLFTAAIDYAENGYPVHPIVGRLWNDAAKVFMPFKDKPEFRPFFETFLKNGAPAIGSLVKLPDHARTLRELAETNCESFYRGRIAAAFDAFSKETGGLLRAEDLAAYRAEWVEPITTNYKGYEVCEIPPNGHGIVALMTLNMLQKMDTSLGRDAEPTVHKQLEAMKLAFIDGQTYIADPRFMKMKTDFLLSDAYAAGRSGEIGAEALLPKPIDPQCGGTVYMCAADSEGNMISHIQSNFRGFGSGIVIPGCGIALNDRGNGFKLDPQSDDCIAPGKKPYHTIIPGFLMKDGRAVGPFGVMGGFMQPQGHVQVLMNMIDYGLNPQEALDAPRWQWIGGRKVELEAGFDPAVAEGLSKRGHEVTVTSDFLSFGRGQMILRGDDGVLIGATEPRTDGCVAAW
ncbi:gamma-glutamyltransferase family protein [Pyramidobacter sp. C12-8]|uniref:gamma-glutamyltransferase family protein n=1 Tax=Pyramidobacter sp. C12-8 TaxID=1943580 RepID=UPI00098FB977|nr:gamma-glutamyltransferase family protein [Pyramidobacter sp. C12-8]OON89948.1 gamma-glutamyltransferase [Pyramidobacter sp. C12-8]